MFDFSTDYRLENNVVQLRPLVADDFEHLHHFSTHPAIWTYSSIRVNGPEDFKSYLRLAMEGKAKQEEYPFIVFDKRTQTYAGSTRFYDIQLAKQTLQLGYTWYGEEFQGTGLNKNCKWLLLDFAFEKMDMERVEFRANNLNERSIAAMKSIGCTVEGILRKNLPHHTNHTRRDTIVLSILKDEWFGGIKEELKYKIDLR